MIEKVKKIGSGTGEDPYRPDPAPLDGKNWGIAKEYPTEYDVNIKDVDTDTAKGLRELGISPTDVKNLVAYAKAQGWIS